MCSGIRTTCQFNTKVFYPEGKEPILWSSDPLENYGFDEDRLSFYADNVAVTLSDDGAQYTVKSAVNESSIVNLTFTKTAPGFQVGKDGTTLFGTDPAQPWGSMRHAFWPRNRVEGSIITKTGELDFKGHGSFLYALQGMKPHHAGMCMFAARHCPGSIQGPQLSIDSREMELRRFPITNLFGHHDGVCDSAVVRFDPRQRGRDST